MNCRNTDHDLLFLAHGELSYPRRIMVQRHIRSCPRCQERLAQLTAASHRIAAAVRQPGAPPWTPRVRPSVLASGKLAPTITVLTVTALIGVGIVVTTLVSINRGCSPSPQSVPGNVIGVPCRPGLPSDRCR